MAALKLEENIVDYIRSDSFKDCSVLKPIERLIVSERVLNNLNYSQIGRKFKKSGTLVRNIVFKSLRLISLYLNHKSPSMLIQDSLLSVRVKNAFCYDENIKCLKDFHNFPVEKVLRRNLGMKSVNEIQEYIKDLGFSLKATKNENIESITTSFKPKIFKDFTDKDLIHWIYSLSKLLRNLYVFIDLLSVAILLNVMNVDLNGEEVLISLGENMVVGQY